nr:RHS repeat-associated core domain-containing protein [Xanthomonas sp. SHU 199]
MSNFQGIRMALRLMAAAALLLLVAFGVSAQTVRYIHTDGLGSVVLVTDKDRNVLERREYEPYGGLVNQPVTDGPGYTGHVMDAATGLIYMQQRYCDSPLGVFLSVDPVSAYEQPVNQFNRYRYANGNPYTLKDVDGRQAYLPYVDAYLRHYYRNGLNKTPRNKKEAQAASNWRQMSDAQSAFHQQGEDGAQNTKWVDDSGHNEAVYDGNGNLVTDLLNGGTYNYASPDDWGGHLMYDVIPYFLWGNGPIIVSANPVMGSAPIPTVTIGSPQPIGETSVESPPPPPPPEVEKKER